MEPKYQIRLANNLDLKSILEIIEDARKLSRKLKSKQWLGDDGYPDETTFKQDIKHQALYVATLNNFVVGVIYISSSLEPTYAKIKGKWLTLNNNYGVVHRLAVRQAYYGQGVSIALMEHAEKILRSQKIKSIRIDTAKENQPMQRLIKKLNYQYCGLINLNKYQGEEDIRLAYEKII